jgi:hypothetical protein
MRLTLMDCWFALCFGLYPTICAVPLEAAKLSKKITVIA